VTGLFVVFVPLLVMSIATMMGWFEPSKGFEWLALPSVCLALGVAIIAAAQLANWDISPLLTAIVANVPAIIAAGVATVSKEMSTVAARGVSTATTGGLGNFVVATGEWIGAILLYSGLCACSWFLWRIQRTAKITAITTTTATRAGTNKAETESKPNILLGFFVFGY
jgi:hypothetical protein